MAKHETDIPPPWYPPALWLNGAFLDYALRRLFDQHLPEYGYLVTSAGRSKEHNAAVGGAENGAHIHNLAKDFTLTKGGARVPESEATTVYETRIAPYWDPAGFTEFEASSQGEGYHIHAGLPRTVNNTTTPIAWGLTGLTLAVIVSGIVAVS